MSVKVSYPQILWHHVFWGGWHASHALDVRLVCNVVFGRKSGRISREAAVSGSEYACERIVDTFYFRDLFACITFSGDPSYFSGRLSLVLDVFSLVDHHVAWMLWRACTLRYLNPWQTGA